MTCSFFIRLASTAVCLSVAGCASPLVVSPTPVSQDELDAFLAGGRDPRYASITVYQGPAGPRFEFANRLHQDRAAQVNMISPRTLPLPVLPAKTAAFTPFNLLLDSSARQSWLLFRSVKAMDYRPFAPPMGEYADHVLFDIPGYAGVGNKIILDALHVESPIFYIPPANGGLGPLGRLDPSPEADETEQKARDALRANLHAVMGAALMRSFAYIRIDFPSRSVRFSTHGTFRPPVPSAVVASLPLREWRERPAVEGLLDGKPILLVVDTAGDFHLSVPAPAAYSGDLALGDLHLGPVPVHSHSLLGLPEKFSARLGIRALTAYILTLDYKQQRLWIEDPALMKPKASKPTNGEDVSSPEIQYRGITR
ncbi:MAG: hypothetical protein LBN38_00035 [Verrucomicrobiota bacterium]|nr:hypothetical protein [Verrucomicrobiota bacterium]